MNILKTNWLSFLIIGLFVWLMFKPSGCGPTPSWMNKGRDTIKVVTNTVRELQPIVYGSPQAATQVSSIKPVYIPQPYQVGVAESTYNGLLAQYQDLSSRFKTLTDNYLAINKFKDSISLKDSTGQWVGVVNLDQDVTENKLKTITPTYQLAFPHTTTTVTLREPPHNQVYLGLGLTGNTAAPVNGANVGLLFKNKRDRIFLPTAGFQFYNNLFVPQFGLSTYWKLSLKK